MRRKIICPKCGRRTLAIIPGKGKRCPYCGYINLDDNPQTKLRC